MRLKDKVAIITGAGSGLGAETARRFAREGANVVVADYNLENAVKVALEINGAGLAGEAIAVRVNVADRETVAEMVELVIGHYGRIDILINNAGIIKDNQLLKMTPKEWQDVLDVNLTGVFNMTQAVVPHMIAQGKGKIINTSSVVRGGNFGQSNYVATKAGVVGLTGVWAREFGKKGINVNAVAFGFMVTPMTEKVPQKVLDMMKEKTMLKRLGTPEDGANAYLFLASNESDYITNTVLEVNGGLVI